MQRFIAGLCAAAILIVVGYAAASRNSSGTYSRVAGPYVTGQTITAGNTNGELNDISSELTSSLDRSGRGGMLAALRGIDGTVAAPALSFTSETGSGLFRNGAGDLRMALLGANVEQWASTGPLVPSGKMLAIGAAPTYPLDVQSLVGNTAARFGGSGIELALMPATASGAIGYNLSNDGANWKYLTTNFGYLLFGDTNGFGIYTTPSGTAGNTATVTERMRVSTTGVTIGTTASNAAVMGNAGMYSCTTVASTSCTATVPSGAKCVCNFNGLTPPYCIPSVTTTTLTCTASSGSGTWTCWAFCAN